MSNCRISVDHSGSHSHQSSVVRGFRFDTHLMRQSILLNTSVSCLPSQPTQAGFQRSGVFTVHSVFVRWLSESLVHSDYLSIPACCVVVVVFFFVFPPPPLLSDSAFYSSVGKSWSQVAGRGLISCSDLAGHGISNCHWWSDQFHHCPLACQNRPSVLACSVFLLSILRKNEQFNSQLQTVMQLLETMTFFFF